MGVGEWECRVGAGGRSSETSSQDFSRGMAMSSFKGEEAKEQWLGERKGTQFECKVQGLVGVVGATEDGLSHFANPAEWEARTSF